jgi:hypothetical protein
MKRFPAPTTVTAAVVGFALGTFVTLAATGAFTAASHRAESPATLPPSSAMTDSELAGLIRRLAERQLGPSYPNAKLKRVVSVSVTAASNLPLLTGRTRRADTSHSVSIVFRLNDHPLGKAWRFRAAKADVFAVMKAIYTSSLPVSDVEMEGIFPLKQGKAYRQHRAVVAYIDHARAASIPWKRWGRDKEARVWKMLSYSYTDRRFA